MAQKHKDTIICLGTFEGNGQRPSHRGDGIAYTDREMYTLNAVEVHGKEFRNGIGL